MYNLFIAKLKFQQPLLQSSVSHDLSNIIEPFDQEPFLIIINVENNVVTVNIFCGNCDTFTLFRIFRSSKNSIKNVMLVCNITNIFNVTFEQFNMAFLNKSINKKKYIYM